MQQGDPVRVLIWKIVCSVVDSPDKVTVEITTEKGVTRYQVHVTEKEVGQVIGKQGRTARALRTILGAIAMKEKRRIELDIATGSAPRPLLQIEEAQT